MAVLGKCYAKLALTLNARKSAVASVFGRKFLGYSVWRGPEGEIERRVANKAVQSYKAGFRQMTRRSGRRSRVQVVQKLRTYLLG